MRHRDDPVLERVGRVGGVVLDPDLAQPEPLGEAVGADQRRQARLERIAGAARRTAGSRRSARSRASRPGSCRFASPGRGPSGRRRPRAGPKHSRRRSAPRAGRSTRIPCISGSRVPSDLAPSVRCLERKNLRRCGAEVRSDFPHIFQASTSPAGIGTFLGLDGPRGCRGFIGPVPPPLSMWRLCARRLYQRAARRLCARRTIVPRGVPAH